MTNARFVFVGNRRFVLERMLRENICPVHCFVVQGTHLERDLQNGLLGLGQKEFTIIDNKISLLDALRCLPFDVLVSNGCPYILPVAELPPALYVNIHPSCLPDLRGIDPVIGAVLFGKDGGATCHVMDEGIDTGDIIAQVRIPLSDDLDVTTLYQLSFIAEQQVFSQSLARAFQPLLPQRERPGLLYYSRRPEDRIVTFQEPNEVLLKKIKAFNNRAAGCVFTVNGRGYKVYSATRMHNPFLTEVVASFGEGVVAFSYECCIIFGKDGEVLRLQDIVSLDDQALQVGDRLFGE